MAGRISYAELLLLAHAPHVQVVLLVPRLDRPTDILIEIGFWRVLAVDRPLHLVQIVLAYVCHDKRSRLHRNLPREDTSNERRVRLGKKRK